MAEENIVQRFSVEGEQKLVSAYRNAAAGAAAAESAAEKLSKAAASNADAYRKAIAAGQSHEQALKGIATASSAAAVKAAAIDSALTKVGNNPGLSKAAASADKLEASFRKIR